MQFKFFGACLVLSLASACGGSAGVAEGEGEAVATSQPSVVARLEVQGMEYNFVDSGVGLGIDIVGSESAGRPLAFELFEQFGELTLLEVYLALAPEGATPHDRLIASHDVEAQALGRPDNAVKSVRLDPQAPVEKGTQQNCRNWANFKRGGGSITIGSTPFDDSTLTMGTFTATTRTIATTVCNTTHSGSDSGLAANVDMKIGAGAWTQVGSTSDTGSVFIFPANANASDANTYTHIQAASGTARRLRVNGFFLGAGHAYHMAIAY